MSVLKRGASLLLCATAMAGIAHAQTAEPPAQAPSSAPAADQASAESGFGDIIVTAQRRSQNVQDVPISIAVISGEELQDRAVSDVQTLVTSVPSVSLQQTGKGGFVFIRGVGGALDPQTGSPAVSFNVDGVYQQQTAVTLSSLYDISRVEVLRGPQGTLAGRNASAGTVNVITNRPSDTFEAIGMVRYGNFDNVEAQGVLNLPVSDTFAVRAAVGRETRDGYLSNGNQDVDNVSGRLKALWDISPDVSLLLSGSYIDMQGVPGDVPAPLDRDDPWDATAPRGDVSTHAKAFSAELTVDLGFATFTAIPSYQRFRSTSDTYYVNQHTITSTTEEQTGAEVRLASPEGSTVEWVFGLYGLDSKASDFTTLPDVPVVTAAPDLHTRSLAAFGQVDVPLSENLHLTTGLRYTDDRINKTAELNPTTDVESRDSFHSLDYRVGMRYEFSPDSMVYAQIASGYKAGGFFDGTPPNTFEPERLIAYSIGTKNQFLDRRVRLNAEGFFYDYSNYQVQQPGIVGGGGFGLIVYNAGAATLYGAELEGQVLVSDNDRVDGSISYLHAEFDSFLTPGGPPTFTPNDFSGYTLPNAPEWSGALGYEHDFHIAGGAIVTARAEAQYSSSYYAHYTLNPQSFQDGYTLGNLYLTYESPDAHYSISTYIKNIGDEAVIQQWEELTAGPTVQVGAPRTFGIMLRAKY